MAGDDVQCAVRWDPLAGLVDAKLIAVYGEVGRRLRRISIVIDPGDDDVAVSR
jgi:hypothetical protein